MKILFFDSMFPKGHKVINGRYLDILSKLHADIFVCSEDGWFELDERFHQVKRKWIQPCNGKIKPRLQIMANIYKSLKIIKEVNPDIIYFASYDIVTLFVYIPLLYKYRTRIFLQEHNNVDQLDNKIKFNIYSTYKNLFHHFVFEEYIRDKLISYGVKSSNISIVPHPIPKAYVDSEDESIKLENLVVGLSNSNSDNLVQEIISEQKEKHFLNKTKYKMVLKSNNSDYEDENLKVLNGWISSNEYSRYCVLCKYFIIPFPKKGYSYRVSNVFMEAISNGKKVLSSRFPLVDYYEKKYPDICSIYDYANEIPELLNKDMSNYLESRKQFIEDHSDRKIFDAFYSAFSRRNT